MVSLIHVHCPAKAKVKLISHRNQKVFIGAKRPRLDIDTQTERRNFETLSRGDTLNF
jgi:hypothetical protein